MNPSITLRGALLAAAAVVLCAPAFAGASVPTALSVAPSSTGQTFEIAQGGTLTVNLDNNNPSTGYSWVFGSPLNTNILKIVSDTTTIPTPTDPPTTGAAEPRTILMRAVKAGTTKVNLIYVRSGAPSEPASTLAITVKVIDVGARCRSSDLGAIEQADGWTMSVGVRELRVKGTNCTRARAIARVAARHNLASRGAVAAETIGGFKVTLRRPCSGCTPVWVASARRGKARVTFDLLGGAR